MKHYYFFLLLFVSFKAPGQDTVKVSPKKTKGSFTVTTRLHSTGHFPFTGSYINRHLNADINVSYTRKNFGVFLFKSHDLEEPHSAISYLQPGVFRKFSVNRKLTLRILAGYIFNQTTRFSDKDSDAWTALITSWQPHSGLRIENTALVFNLAKSELSCQLANRTVFSYFVRDFKLDWYVWNNLTFETQRYSASTQLSVSFPKIKINDKLGIITSVAAQTYVTDYKPSYAMRHGFLFTIAVPLEL
jgi:hypothetical protein